MQQNNIPSHTNHAYYTQTLTNYIHTHIIVHTYTFYTFGLLSSTRYVCYTLTHLPHIPHYMNTIDVARVLSGLRLLLLTLMAYG